MAKISPSIENIYIKIDKNIQLTESYTEIKGLAFIIKACRLKPIKYRYFAKESPNILFYDWMDEFGNSFSINHKKEIDILYNNLTIDKKMIISTDLYYGLSINKIVKISKFIHLIAGKDEDLFQECYLLTFLGIDNYLRSYLFWYGQWKQVSPLLLGIKNLKLISAHHKVQDFFQPQRKMENYVIPCVEPESFLSCVPMPEKLSEILKTKYETAYEILK